MKIILSHRLDIAGAPEPLARKIRDTFTIENPAYLDNAKMFRLNGGTDHWLIFYENHPGGDLVMMRLRDWQEWHGNVEGPTG